MGSPTDSLNQGTEQQSQRDLGDWQEYFYVLGGLGSNISLKEFLQLTRTQTIALVHSYNIRKFNEIDLPALKDRFAQMGDEAIDSILNESDNGDSRRKIAFKRLVDAEKPAILQWLDTQDTFEVDTDGVDAVPNMRPEVAEGLLQLLADGDLKPDVASPLWKYIPALKLTTKR